MRAQLYFRLVVSSIVAAGTGLLLAFAGLGVWGFYLAAVLTCPVGPWIVAATRTEPREPPVGWREPRGPRP
jgi:hypothetical protein